MSKAEELATEIQRHVGVDSPEWKAGDHLRALEANRQMLVEALELCVEFINEAQILEAQWHWEPVKQALTALEQAKELT